MTFGFSLYAISLQVTQITYLGRELGELRRLGPPEGSKIYHCYVISHSGHLSQTIDNAYSLIYIY